jgi:signal transduction histidine kinase
MAASVKPEPLEDRSPVPRAKTLRSSGRHAVAREDISGLLAHDLKTPLAALAMNLDFVLAELAAASAPVVRSALEDCRNANARAIRIVSDMADAARLVTGDYRPTLCEFCPTGVVELVARGAEGEAAAREVRIAWSSTGDNLTAEPDLLARALDRLVERALRHARQGSTLTIDHHGGTLTVRAHTAMPYQSPSRAIATHFAEAAVEALGGTVDTESDGDRELVFRITLSTPEAP